MTARLLVIVPSVVLGCASGPVPSAPASPEPSASVSSSAVATAPVPVIEPSPGVEHTDSSPVVEAETTALAATPEDAGAGPSDGDAVVGSRDPFNSDTVDDNVEGEYILERALTPPQRSSQP